MMPVDSCSFFRFLSSTICAKRERAVLVSRSSAFSSSMVAAPAAGGNISGKINRNNNNRRRMAVSQGRSEERRVGKECRDGWGGDGEKEWEHQVTRKGWADEW